MSMMKLARKAISLFSNDAMPKSTRRHYQRQWIRQIANLGDNWILAEANRVQRKT